MKIINSKPTTAGRRGLVSINRSDLWKGGPVKGLTEGLRKTGGRNNHGRITVRHIGGGHKRLYRIVDFKRRKDDLVAEVVRLEYDPNRSAYIALLKYTDGVQSYILAPAGLKIGSKVRSGPEADFFVGNAMEISRIPVGTLVHNVELYPGKGGQIGRSAGCSISIMARESGYVLVRLSSGEVRRVRNECRATIGEISNPEKKNQKLGKAGRNRWKGVRPTVRGVAQNPIDHPHGGGEGKTSGGRHPVTPWGKKTKGLVTRKNKRTDKFIVKGRRRK